MIVQLDRHTRRSIVHIGMIVFALLAGRFPSYVLSFVCLAALIFNIFILPVISRHSLERDDELQKGYSTGIIAYPLILFILSLVFYDQQVFLVIGWGAMAFGDGFASVIGRRYGRHAVSSGKNKTWEGLLAFVVLGSAFTFLFLLLLPAKLLKGAGLWDWLLIIFIANTASALLESLVSEVNDNLVVPVSASFIAWLLFVSPAPSGFTMPDHWWQGGLLLLLFGIGSLASRKISPAGFIAGMIISLVIFLGGGMMGLTMLIAFFLSGTLVSHYGLKKKEARGLDQENKGIRTSAHAMANAGVAMFCAYLAWIWPQSSSMYVLMLASSIAASASDTFSSEIGNVKGSRFVNILTFKPDVRGRDGVISWEGSLAGLGGAGLIALIYLLFTGDILRSGIVLLAGFTGNIMDSLLGATAERSGWLGNHTVNFLCSLTAAAMAYLIMQA